MGISELPFKRIKFATTGEGFYEITQDIAPSKYKYDNFFKRIKKKIELLFDKFNSKKKFIIEKNKKINGKKIAESFKFVDKNKISNTLYVQGNYENHEYFKKYRSDIIKIFKPNNNLIFNNNSIINELKNSNSVSIHIRRHKYSEQLHEKKNKYKLLKSENFTSDLISYVNKSVFFFEKKIDNPVFFIWSNDLDGLKNEFNPQKFKFINNKNTINDFNLFSFAKHFIVGASSFHWWGAWLNESPNKICTRPSNLNPSNNEKFYPENWIKI